MAIESKNLAAEFRDFLGRLPGAESLDDPAVMPNMAEAKRADYLLFQRSVIAEVKILESDPGHKAQAVVDRYRTHPDFPLFHGRRQFNAVLEHLPKAAQDEIRGEVYRLVTTSISHGCEEANRQIRATRAQLRLPNAAGIVFILNDDIGILSPNILAARIRQQMHKRDKAGADRFPEFAYVCIITWAHVVQSEKGVPAHPILIIDGPDSRKHPATAGQIEYIIIAWTCLHDSQLLPGNGASLEEYALSLPTRSLNKQTVKRHELWRAEYRARRYLGSHETERLVQHGRKVMDDLTPYFLGRKPNLAQDLLLQCLQRWTHFLEECELRNLNMKEFTSHIRRSAS